MLVQYGWLLFLLNDAKTSGVPKRREPFLRYSARPLYLDARLSISARAL